MAKTGQNPVGNGGRFWNLIFDILTYFFQKREFYSGIPGLFKLLSAFSDRMRWEVFPITLSQLAIELGMPGNGNKENLINDLGWFENGAIDGIFREF